ncbi:hypothetical protein GCM10017620_31260 [Brevundimonas intermedia]|uniref:Flagellar biosynthesis protein FliO n=1 Tax=Brevundimonas intermedia TaxID=74315 RepID=A0ABQ5TBF5_9CAUL|nr:hypothetical protein [Brevundimonas intermedia]GLK50152.1 hypothetical protein GCM10017620_31260 [Brevundimonas intermedia]
MARVAGLSALALGLQASPALAQTLGQGASDEVPWVRVAAALLLCLGLAVGAAFAIRRRATGAAPRLDDLNLSAWVRRVTSSATGGAATRLTGVETRRLSPQVSVSVFKCDGRSFMVAASLQGQLVLVALDGDGDGEEEDR